MINITYQDDSYDGIISNCSLFHILVEELSKTLESFSRILKLNRKLLLILQEGNGETLYELFFSRKIRGLLQQYGFEIGYLTKEESPNEIELVNGKLIVLSNNTKELEYSNRKI